MTTVTPGNGPSAPTRLERTRAAFREYTQKRMLLMLALGFSSGLPILLVFGTLTFWLRSEHVSRSQIGLFFYVGLAYSIKFFWSPLVDQVRIPVLAGLVGNRRAWLILSQIFVAIGLIGISFANPAEALYPIAIFSVLTAFSSATQDICVDAWRIESTPKDDQGSMLGAYQLGYRIGMIVAGAGALVIAAEQSWYMSYLIMAALMSVGLIATLLSPPIEKQAGPVVGEALVADFAGASAFGRALQWLYRAAVAPLVDYFARHKWTGLVILALVGVFRLPDFVMGTMANTLYNDLGFSLETVAAVAKFLSVGFSFLGILAGSVVVRELGVLRTLFVSAIVTVFGNLVFAWLATQGQSVSALAIAVGAENFAAGFAGTALIAYMSSLVNKTFTATQYALFSSFYALPGKLLGGTSGFLVDWFSAHRGVYAGLFGGLPGLSDNLAGYVPFYCLTASMGIPAILLTIVVMRLDRAAPVKSDAPAH
jgi:PAT family beta-lactamase induction signal transducer AmpG